MKELKKKLKINRVIFWTCIVLFLLEMSILMEYNNKIVLYIIYFFAVLKISAIIVTFINIKKLKDKIDKVDTIQRGIKKD